MIKIFKKKQSKYTEPSKLMAFNTIKNVLESCETIKQLSYTWCWIEDLYIIYKWEYDVYYHHLRAIYDTKRDEMYEEFLIKGE